MEREKQIKKLKKKIKKTKKRASTGHEIHKAVRELLADALESPHNIVVAAEWLKLIRAWSERSVARKKHENVNSLAYPTHLAVKRFNDLGYVMFNLRCLRTEYGKYAREQKSKLEALKAELERLQND